jgi:hypothetical protein
VKTLLKDQPSLIVSKHRIMQKYGLKPEEYEEMLSVFSEQIEKALPIITGVKPSSERVEEPILRLMMSLWRVVALSARRNWYVYMTR